MTLLQIHRERVGRRVRGARLQGGYSLDALAAKVGTSRQHLIRIEKGQHLPRPAMLAAIAEATGKDASFFESEDEEESDLPSLDVALRSYVRKLIREEVQA